MSLATANRYATALGEVLEKPGSAIPPDDALVQLRSFADLYASSFELRTVLAAPSVALGQKRVLITDLCERLGMPKPLRNLLYIMLDHRRLSMMPELVQAFSRRIDNAHGVERVEATSALPLDEGQRSSLIGTFEKISGRRVEAAFQVDESLLGGVVVRMGGAVYDASLKAQLQALDRSMTGLA